jgi:hypothetical protein
MAFSKREQSFCVLEYAITSWVVTVLAANQDNYVHGLFFEENVESFSLYQHKNCTICCVVCLLQIFKMFHRLKNKPEYLQSLVY